MSKYKDLYVKKIDYSKPPPNVDEYEYNERAGIKEFEGNLSRYDSEKQAYIETKQILKQRNQIYELF